LASPLPAATATATPEAAAAPAPNPAALTFSAYVDLYYSYNFNNPQPLTAPTNTNAATSGLPSGNSSLRGYDRYADQVALSLAELTIKNSGKETGFLIDFDFGPYADYNAYYFGTSDSVIDSVNKHIGQLILTYTPAAIRNLTIDIGKMPTHIGLEGMKAKDNWNYSRTLSFTYGSPFWHTGVHAGYNVVPDKLKASVYVYNGWDTVYSYNGSVNLGAQLAWTPSANTTWNFNYIGGPNQADNTSNIKQMFDTNLTQNLSDVFALGFDFLLGQERGVIVNNNSVNAFWSGLQVLAKWQIAKNWYMSPRFEIYRDSSGYTLAETAGQTLYSATLTESYKLADALETRLEFRWDQSSYSQAFTTGSGHSGNQSTLALSVLYVFP
jgi:hypothetical protein